jgi:outer membrane protein TolC
MTTNRAMSPVADGTDNLTAGVSFNLPVRRAARDAALRESESQVEKGVHEWERQRDQITRDVEQLYATLDGLESQLAQFRDTIVPSLEQALEISTDAYETNQVTMSELIELRRELLKLRSQERELQAQRQKRRADLGWLMAEPDWL